MHASGHSPSWYANERGESRQTEEACAVCERAYQHRVRRESCACMHANRVARGAHELTPLDYPRIPCRSLYVPSEPSYLWARQWAQVYFRQFADEVPVAQLVRGTADVIQELTRTLFAPV